MNRFGKDEIMDMPRAASALRERETIVALSTPPGMSAIAVIRISGPEASMAVKALAGTLPLPRKAALVDLRDPQSGEAIDQALLLWFPGPRSYSGEDMAEFHVHGGRAVVTGLIEILLRFDGIRLAEPGEFTRRAFEAGKLSLSQIEGLGDLLHAETATQRRHALTELNGQSDQLAERLRTDLVEMLAYVEALIEFPDEEDAASLVGARIASRLAAMREGLQASLIDSKRATMIREGLQVVIVGPPNAGKSSLLNSFAGSDIAIVSSIAGTTRDVIEVSLDLDGVKVRLVDTAGLRESLDEIEQEGVRRALLRVEDADLVLYIDDGLDQTEASRQARLRFVSDTRLLRNDLPIWTILNKMDDGASDIVSERFISVHRGHGLSRLKDDLVRWSKQQTAGSAPMISRARHRQIYADIVLHLREAEVFLGNGDQVDLASEHLRSAVGLLGCISGRIGVEEVLDQLFKSFCIGK